MHNPFVMEQQFQSLKNFLSYPATSRERLKRIQRFINLAVSDPAISESYVLELVQELPDIVDGHDCTGCEPYILRSLYENLLYLEHAIPALSGIERFKPMLETLRNTAIKQYAYTGNLRILFGLLDKRFIHFIPPWIQDNGGEGPPRFPYRRIERAYELAKEKGDPIADALYTILSEWGDAPPAGHGGDVMVPVVERLVGAEQADARDSGSLRSMRIHIHNERQGSGDDIHTGTMVFGARTNIDEMLDIPVKAARRLLAETHPNIAKRYVSAYLEFTPQYPVHEGRSANAAIAALFYTALLTYFDQRTTIKVNGSVAITGDVLESGVVKEIDAGSIRTKIRAALFSRVEYLIVPRTQFAKAEKALAEVGQFYPERHIELIGIGNIRELFYDRRLTDSVRTSFTRHTLKRLRRQKVPVILGIFLIISLVLLFRIMYGPFDIEPASAEYQNNYIVVKNKHNRVIEEIWVGDETIRFYRGFISSSRKNPELFHIHDITGDGRKEIVWIDHDVTSAGRQSVIYCKTIGEDELLWSRVVNYNIIFPDRPNTAGGIYRPEYIRVIDFGGDIGEKLIITARHIMYFPTVISMRDPMTGEETDHYLHIGGIRDLEYVDVTGNGVREILFGGISNAFDSAVFGILDPRRLHGHAPTQAGYFVEGYSPAHHYAYVRIPTTKLGDHFRSRMRYNMTRTIEPMPVTGSIQVWVEDVLAYVIEDYQVSDVTIVILFDSDLRVDSVGMSDSFILLARQLVRQGILDQVPDLEYFKEYQRIFLYWNGTGWQNEPVFVSDS
jgi:hypothetical protein